MGSIILFIIFIYLFKRGLVDRRGFSDVAKVFFTVGFIIILISVLSSPIFWLLVSLFILALIAGIIAFVTKYSGKQRAEKYGWDTEEYQKKYAEAVEKFKQIYKEQRGFRSNMSTTQRMAQDIEDEKRAREAAAAEVDAVFKAKQSDSGNNTYSGTKQAEPRKKKEASKVRSAILPRSPKKRIKIVEKFNEAYKLLLTEEQIKRIVDASYMSNAWKREVEAMYDKYDSVNQWMYGETAYLRAYLRAFAVQDVTSDFQMQMQIVMDSFEEIFTYSDEISMLSIDQRISRINSKFMTNFDEITYMIAYRFLESLGLKHQLDKTTLNRVDGTFDDLVEKYDKMSGASVDEELANTVTQTDS